MSAEFPQEWRNALAEEEGARRNGQASDGRGWFRTAAEGEECYALADDRLAALSEVGALQPPGAVTRVVECEIEWVDVRSSRGDAHGITYEWETSEFDAALARAIAAAGRLHKAPVMIRKREVSTWPDGSTLIGPWQEVPDVQ